jgi:hypothetical protein
MFRQWNFDRFVSTRVHLFECQLYRVMPFATMLRRSTRAAEHVLENLRNVRAVWHLLLLRLIGSKLIVACTSVWIIQNLVRLANLLKLFGVASSVRVVFHRELLVRLFDFIDRGALFKTERLVVSHTDT